MKTLYLIGGPMGVGKTTVSRILQRQLPDCVFLDGDWCWDASPFRVTEETKAMVLDNICHLLQSFLRCSAYQNIVFCWVMHQQGILDSILRGLDLGGCSVQAVSLVCSEEELRARLARDIAAGLRTGDVVERSLERLRQYGGLNTRKVDTTGKTPQQAAAAVLAAP